MKQLFRLTRCACLSLLLFASVNLYAQDVHPVVTTQGVDKSGTKYTDFRIVCTTDLQILWLPMLPMVFFDSLSADIPGRYYQDSDPIIVRNFSESKLFQADYSKSSLASYYYVLYVLGSRLRDNPNETVKILGSSSSNEAKPGLWKLRAERVKEYLVKICGVNDHQLIVDSLPNSLKSKHTAIPSDVPLIDAENRRVQFIGSWVITKPILVTKPTVSYTPPKIYFNISNVDPNRVKQYDLLVTQEDSTGNIDTLFNPAQPGFLSQLEWRVDEDVDQRPKSYNNIVYDYSYVDTTGFRISMIEPGSMRVEPRNLTNTTLSRLLRDDSQKNETQKVEFDLILFDFKQDSLNDRHRKTLEMIRDQHLIKDVTSISIMGYSDITGYKDSNYKRAQARAKSAKQYLEYLYQDFGPTYIEQKSSIGPSSVEEMEKVRDQLQRLPEQRMYARTVKIVLDTPK